jgi:hypothetical protein
MEMEAPTDLPDSVRSAEDIARRALTLFGVVGIGLRAPRNDIIKWLRDEGLWNELTPSELALLSKEHPSTQELIDAGWKSEALLVLLWVLTKVDSLPPPNQQCDTSLFQELLPPFASTTASQFIASASRRSDEALICFADETLQLHWQARDAKAHGRAVETLDIEIIQERHHAINWTIGYDGLPWDEVTTDT